MNKQTKYIISGITIIIFVLIYVILINTKDDIVVNKISISSIIPDVETIDDNDSRLIDISKFNYLKKIDKKQIYTKTNDEKIFMNNFLEKLTTKTNTFEDKILALEDLYRSNINLIKYHKVIYKLILTEEDERIKHELKSTFYRLYNSEYEPTKEEHQSIVKIINEMIKDDSLRDDTLNHAYFLLNTDEIEELYNNNKSILNKEEQNSIINSYINSSISDGSNPFESDLSQEVSQNITKEKYKERTRNMLGIMAKNSNGLDVTGDSKFQKNILDEEPKNVDPLHYILWMNAKVTTLETELEKQNFINSQFQKISQSYKHEFILRMPTYTYMVFNLEEYLLLQEQNVLNLLSFNSSFEDPKIFESLVEFRAIFLFSNNNNLVDIIDRIIKQLVDILPSYQVSIDILNFIKIEQIFKSSVDFDIDFYISKIQNDLQQNSDNNDNLDLDKIPKNNNLL